jgi:hypothetical protein
MQREQFAKIDACDRSFLNAEELAKYEWMASIFNSKKDWDLLNMRSMILHFETLLCLNE